MSVYSVKVLNQEVKIWIEFIYDFDTKFLVYSCQYSTSVRLYDLPIKRAITLREFVIIIIIIILKLISHLILTHFIDGYMASDIW